MKTNSTSIQYYLQLAVLLALPAIARAQFTFTTNDDQITITKYTGSGGAVIIPGTTNGYPVTSIGYQAFYDCPSLTNVTIPASVTSIGGSAFAGCSKLGGVTFPASIASIEDQAFAYCTSLGSVTIPASVTSIGAVAFAGCTRLTAITVAASNTAYSSLGGVLFDKAQLTLVQYPGGLGGAGYLIPASVTSIAGYAFNECTSLSSVTIPEGVAGIGEAVFAGCTSLRRVAFPASVTSIGSSAFAGCSSLGSITIPASVTSIGEWAFQDCYGLTNVFISDGVTSIGSDAFQDCTSLTGVYFQGNSPGPTNDLTVFSNDNNPGTVYYLPGTTGWGALFDGWPTAPWTLPCPVILADSPGFGVLSNQFGFTISWATNIAVVVEACTNLANPNWLPVETNMLTTGSAYFSDPQWKNYSSRYYRINSQ